MQERMDIKDLSLKYSGITLNNQDIDLLNIIKAKTHDELQEAIDKASNINLSLESLGLLAEDLPTLKSAIFEMYKRKLIDKNEYIREPSIMLREQIEYLKASGKLSDDEIEKLNEIISTSSNKEELIDRVNSTYGEEKAHIFYKTIKECSPIEKSGIKSTTPESVDNLLSEIRNNYNSITIDGSGKYGEIVLQDGTFDFRRLQKALDFAKEEGKTVRINALIFYMDCPEELYNLEKTEENKQIVKDRLSRYVDSITKFIRDNGYSDVVRSIDTFNELANRHTLPGDVPYKYRGDIINVDNSDSDNIKSGWMKHLEIDDLCDVMVSARKNLPNVQFVYNDANLEDPRKMDITEFIINRIQEYEKAHDIKLIDAIGTQMHIDNDTPTSLIESMFEKLSNFGLPIEVTEFDMAMTHDVGGLSNDEVEELRQDKMNEIFDCVGRIKDKCNIQGFTIWSKTDSQNFRVTLENERRKKNGQEPITTLNGGFYTEDMEPKSKAIKESKSQSNELNNMLNDKSEIKQVETMQKEKPKVLTKKNNNNPNSEKGYAEVISISSILITSSIVLLLLAIFLFIYG